MACVQDRIGGVQAEHDLDENETRQLTDPVASPGLWVASCTCGTYTCRPQPTPEDARALVYQHIRKIFRRLEKEGFFAEEPTGGES